MVREREDRRERRRAGSSTRDSKHRTGGDWTTLTPPEGIDVFQPPKDGTVRMDIVPYVVGKGNPYARPGEVYYERTYFTHPRIGINDETYVCPNKANGDPCPVCEHRAMLARTSDMEPKELKKLLGSLRPKERQLWLVHVKGKNAEGSTIKLWDVSFHLFGKLLDKKRQKAEDDEVHITDFDDENAGATLKCDFQEESGDGMKWVECYSIEFVSRPNGIDQELLEHGICLDDLLKIPSYDELKKVFLQTTDSDDDEDEDEPTPPKKSKPVPKDDDDEDEPPPKKTKSEPAKETEVELEEGMKVRHRQFGICEILRIGDDGQLGLVCIETGDNKDKKFKGVDPKNVKPLQEVKKPKPTPKGEEDWDEEEDEPKKAPPKKEKKPAPKDDDDDEPSPPKKTTKRPPKDDDDDEWN